MWIKHPRSGRPDTMLSVAMAGFVFSAMFVTASFVAAWVTGNSLFLDNTAAIVGVIVTPSLGAYTARKYTDFKNGNGHKENKC